MRWMRPKSLHPRRIHLKRMHPKMMRPKSTFNVRLVMRMLECALSRVVTRCGVWRADNLSSAAASMVNAAHAVSMCRLSILPMCFNLKSGCKL